MFAKSREGEFVDRIKGLSYEDIALKGGGILNSAKTLASLTENELFNVSYERVEKIIQSGTGALEIKSGYGLSVEAELKILRVIKRIKEKSPISIKATFLGAHAFPAKYKEDHNGYIDEIINTMIPVIAEEKLADYIDVFCERNYFSVDEMERILIAGKAIGLKPKVHVNQFSKMGGVAAAIACEAISVDHLEELGEADIQALKNTTCMPTFLPGCSHFLGIPFGNARRLIEENIPFSLASDYNPGSTPCYNLSQIWSLACIKMKLTAEEAINAATLNGAYAMGISDKVGSITEGKVANLIITKDINSINEIPYSFGSGKISKVILAGKIIN